MGEWQRGKISTFGGPDDTGLGISEGLALCTNARHFALLQKLFLPDTIAIHARNLNPQAMYIAMRWNYTTHPPELLRRSVVLVRNPLTAHAAFAAPIDWGPAEWTGRIADISPGLAKLLELETDDIADVHLP